VKWLKFQKHNLSHLGDRTLGGGGLSLSGTAFAPTVRSLNSRPMMAAPHSPEEQSSYAESEAELDFVANLEVMQEGDSYSEEEPESRRVEPNRRSERALESERRM